MPEGDDRQTPQPAPESRAYLEMRRPSKATEERLEATTKAERKTAGEIDPGSRAIIVAVAVFVLLASLALPHAGSATGFDVLIYSDKADEEQIKLASRVFVWLVVIFDITFSMLALVTRKWVLAWIALAGSAVSVVFGMLSIWTRQTMGTASQGGHAGIGLVIGWLAAFVLVFHWSRGAVVKTSAALEAEDARRNAYAEAESRGEVSPRLGTLVDPDVYRKRDRDQQGPRVMPRPDETDRS